MVILIGLVITAGVAPLAYLRADINDTRDNLHDVELIVTEYVSRDDERWDSINRRLTGIEADVRFLRDQAVRGLQAGESK